MSCIHHCNIEPNSLTMLKISCASQLFIPSSNPKSLQPLIFGLLYPFLVLFRIFFPIDSQIEFRFCFKSLVCFRFADLTLTSVGRKGVQETALPSRSAGDKPSPFKSENTQVLFFLTVCD